MELQYKQIILCKIHAYIGIKGNEDVDKAVTTTSLPYTDCYLTIRTARKAKEEGEHH